MGRYFKIIFLIVFSLALLLLGVLFLFPTQPAQKIIWGMNFSQKQSQNLGVDWRANYLALLDDLRIRYWRISTHWDLLEPERGKYYFSDLDWQIEEAEKREAKIILAIGLKTPRWPECHLPTWAKNLSKEEQQKAVLDLIKTIVLRYKNKKSIWAWQIENEPFFPFGECPPRKKGFLDEEIALVKNLDTRPIITTDSGEWSFWIKMAKKGDFLGVSLYRHVYFTPFSFLRKFLPFFPKGFYWTYPFPPNYYYVKAKIIDWLFHKKIIVLEFQAEPWLSSFELSLDEEKKIKDIKRFQENIEYAKKSGFSTFYLWGGEWWYWLKETQNNSSFWETARLLF